MPKVIVTPEVLEEVSRYVLFGRINKLKIARYKSGANKGRLYAEYSIRDESQSPPESASNRTSASSFLNKAAYHLREGSIKDISMQKKDINSDEYTHCMELGGK